jgi:uncharacterized protein
MTNQQEIADQVQPQSGCSYEQGRAITAIVKPLIDCNLNCTYCYERGNPYRYQRMNCETLKNVIVKFARYNGPQRATQLIWHGGEPLLMGMDFFTKAVEIEEEL